MKRLIVGASALAGLAPVGAAIAEPAVALKEGLNWLAPTPQIKTLLEAPFVMVVIDPPLLRTFDPEGQNKWFSDQIKEKRFNFCHEQMWDNVSRDNRTSDRWDEQTQFDHVENSSSVMGDIQFAEEGERWILYRGHSDGMTIIPAQEIWIAAIAPQRYLLALIETELLWDDGFKEMESARVDYFEVALRPLDGGDLSAVIAQIPKVAREPDEIFAQFIRCGDLNEDLKAQ
ncbi:hypothetical protein WNY37_02420 [Henriciella sp. AS95]|uniref:hypothetical protein n=1 Tax=Henriciella sp. AS95 TaxID=3135782 RepID=UPI0031800ABF